MKTILALFTFTIAACSVPKAVPVQYSQNQIWPARWVARWGGPEVIVTDTSATGNNTFRYSYHQFFKMLAGRHPHTIGMMIIGKLPSEYQAGAAPAPARVATYQPTYATPQSDRISLSEQK